MMEKVLQLIISKHSNSFSGPLYWKFKLFLLYNKQLTARISATNRLIGSLKQIKPQKDEKSSSGGFQTLIPIIELLVFLNISVCLQH